MLPTIIPHALTRTPHGPQLTPLTLPPTPPGRALLRIQLAGLCRTDVEAALGGIPCDHGRVLGHEAVGVVEEVGEGVRPFWVGARVGLLPLRPCEACPACLAAPAPHARDLSPLDPHLPALTGAALARVAACDAPRHVGVDEDGAFATHAHAPTGALYPLPAGLSLARAAYVEPVAAALAPATLLRDEGWREEVWVWGQGRVAALTRRCLAARGFEVRACPPEGDAPAPRGLPCVVETEARREGLEGPARALRPGGLLVLKSRLLAPEGLPLGLVVRRGLRLLSAHYAPFGEAVALLSDPRFEVEDLFGERYPLSSFARAFEEGEGRKVFFEPSLAPVAPRGERA